MIPLFWAEARMAEAELAPTLHCIRILIISDIHNLPDIS